MSSLSWLSKRLAVSLVVVTLVAVAAAVAFSLLTPNRCRALSSAGLAMHPARHGVHDLHARCRGQDVILVKAGPVGARAARWPWGWRCAPRND